MGDRKVNWFVKTDVVDGDLTGALHISEFWLLAL